MTGDLEAQAQQAYGEGDLEGAIAAWEDLHARHCAAGDRFEAARSATMVALHLLIDSALMAPVRGWATRAERLLEGHEEGPLHAKLAAVRAYERFLCGDADAARGLAGRAVILGDRHGESDASIIGSTCLARLALLTGDLDQGLAMLDEVGARLMAGEAEALTTGIMLCEVVCAAQGLALHDLAQEWTDVMDRWGKGAAFGPLLGRCRVHQAELLRISGPADAAEDEALAACAELRPWMRREYGWPLVELGTIRLRRGDLDGAEEAFGEAQTHAWSAQPGLALMHLARGDAELAATQIADAISHPVAVPFKEQPPFSELRVAPFLAAQVEIAFARKDANTASGASDRLEAIALRFPSRFIKATALLAQARARLLAGDDARAPALAATETFAAVGAPYESAQARQVLALAHDRSGRADLADQERSTAARTLATYGHEPSAPRAVQPRPTVGSFLRAGTLRRVRFADREVIMRDLAGFGYLERLLAQPGREFHVLDLAGATGSPAQSGLPVLDDEARAAYQRRLADVEEDLAEAESLDDLARIELAQRDRDYLVAELSQAVGLHGRARMTGSTSERARTRVARSLRYALDRLAGEHPLAADHLRRAVRTGTYCCYAPDPVSPVRWSTHA